jgi:hypothetical protein
MLGPGSSRSRAHADACPPRYRAGSEWRPQRLSAGAGVLATLEHTIPAEERPEQPMRVLRRAIDGVVALEAEPGEADELAAVRASPHHRLTRSPDRRYSSLGSTASPPPPQAAPCLATPSPALDEIGPRARADSNDHPPECERGQ